MKANIQTEQRGFSLVEMVLVVGIFSVLLLVVASVTGHVVRERVRDAQRLVDMENIEKALLLYGHDNGAWPPRTDNDCSGWDQGQVGGLGSNDPFINPLVSSGYFGRTLGDPLYTAVCTGYHYAYYNADTNGCDPELGAYYVLAIRDMETSSGPHPDSPGFSCPGRDWQDNFEWVTGRFEQPWLVQ